MRPFDLVLERDPKNIFFFECNVESFADLVLDFLYYLISMNIHTELVLILVSIFTLWFYLTFSLFLKI